MNRAGFSAAPKWNEEADGHQERVSLSVQTEGTAQTDPEKQPYQAAIRAAITKRACESELLTLKVRSNEQEQHFTKQMRTLMPTILHHLILGIMSLECSQLNRAENAAVLATS